MATRFQVLSSSDFDPTVRGYRKRKIYKKTNTGCQACKGRKVKCDEAKPTCLRCQRNDRQCLYGQPDQLVDEKFPHSSIYKTDLSPLSPLSAVTLLPFEYPTNRSGTSPLQLINHIQTHWSEIVHVRRPDELLRLSQSSPLVRTTILAMSASHLRHLAPGARSHRVAEHATQAVALQSYQQSLNTSPSKLGEAGVAELLLSGTLLNMLAFTLPPETDSDPEESWVFSARDDRLGWLALQAGLRPLMLSIATYLDGAVEFLGEMFLGTAGEHWASVRAHRGLEGVPELWVKMFELENTNAGCEPSGGNDTSLSFGDVFRAPALVLTFLRVLEPNGVNVFLQLQFLSKMGPEFRSLLYDRDERALWLFGYWLGLMCRFGDDLWWCHQRVRRDYFAINVWLHKRGLSTRLGVEGEMWTQMLDDLRSVSGLLG